MDMLLVFLLLLSTLVFYLVFPRRSSSKRLPPGPFALPIVGNYFQLGDAPYITLTNLAKTYGPLMRVKLGSRDTVVVSSVEMAKEVLMKQDHICGDRIPFYVVEAQDHHLLSVGSLPLGSKWSLLRRVCKEHVFAASKMEDTEALRQRKLQQLRDHLQECSDRGAAVDIGELVTVTNLNLLSNTLFSIDFAAYGSAEAEEVREAVCAVTRNAGTPNPAEYFPFLRPFDPKGLRKGTGVAYGTLLRIYDEIIGKRMEARSKPGSYSKKLDLLEALLDFNQKNPELTITDIKHLLLDLVVGGADSTSIFVQWVMTELLRDPKKMSKAKAELRSVLGADGGKQRQAVESDIPKLSYLNAVIKETFRFRPGAPLLPPHRAREDVVIGGYTIPKGMAILVNVYAITRDPNVWPDPDSFEPERFFRTNIDYKGQFHELIPFGSGRRLCPGVPLVHLMSHMLVAHMIHSFDWKVEDLDESEGGGVFIIRTNPIKAIPVKKKGF